MAEKKHEKSFEQQLEELESIINNMENNEVSLETMMSEYEKGTNILAQLNEKLQVAQGKLLKLSCGNIEEMQQHD